MKEEHKIIGRPVWFNLHDGTLIGIVLMNNGYEDKSYIGRGKGRNEKEDIEHILSWGTPFPIESAKIMIGVKK